MKKLLLVAFISSLGLSACETPAPEPVYIDRHHYHTDRIYVSRPTPPRTPARPPSRPKAPPSVGGSSGAAEGFRAIEQPSTYSQ